MKITVNIDTTAQEMREFLGLPNVQPLQDEMMEKIRDNMEQGVAGFDPVTLMKPLLPPQMQQSVESLQKAFWDAFRKAAVQPGGTENKAAGEEKSQKR